jgi:hypothetical protein
MLFIVMMSGLIGFVAGVRMRLLMLTLLAALVAVAAGAGAIAMALPGWQVALSVVLSVTVFELAAFTVLALRFGLTAAPASGEAAGALKPVPAVRSRVTALR